jgi:hypothetical protein
MVEVYRRHPELVSGSTVPLAPFGEVLRWMLKQVQHDEKANA